MKTKLLKKWRQEAMNRIGVLEDEAKGTFSVIFDKSVFGNVSRWEEHSIKPTTG